MATAWGLREFLELVGELVNRWGSVVVNRFYENQDAEAGDSSLNQRNGNVRRWKPLPSND
jgi:hypothetical protein